MNEPLRALLKLTEEMVSTIEMPDLLEKILKAGVQFTGAERGTIVLVEGPKLVFGAAHVLGGGEPSGLVKISSTAVKEAVQSRKPILSGRAPSETRFDKAASVAELGIRSILCLPLQLKERVVGALYLDHTEKDEAFAGVEMEFLEMLGNYAAIAIENARLYRESIRDPLTGLFSHRYFETALEREGRRADRSPRPISMLFLDLDHFKLVNDTHGHRGGDAVLREISRRLRAIVRGEDLVAARYAGDEFEILLPETRRDQAREVAERILEEIRAEPIKFGRRKIGVTASIGVASIPDDAGDVAALGRMADAAMYRAKRQGRNQVFLFEGKTEARANSEAFADRELDTILRSHDALAVVGMLGRLMEFIQDPNAMLEQALELVVRVTGAENGVVAVIGAEDKPDIIARHGTIDDPEVSRTISDKAMQSRTAMLIADATKDKRFEGSQTVAERSIRSLIAAGIVSPKGKTLGVLYLENRTRPSLFTDEDRELVEIFARKLAPGLLHSLDYERAMRKIERLRESVTRNLEELGFKYAYDQIIGRTEPMLALLKKAEGAIESEYPVIIEGETGTGKELVARIIHYNSARKELPFVAENCGAITTSLLESELFGHRKGAFTGATANRKGLFQIADGGSLFLDEIEEMPEEMQIKLLRALETKEVRPVGADRVVKVDVRVICSSNRNLRELVDSKKFRQDLYYRLNVFHLTVPTLRERKEDIPLLVDHFLARCAEESGKPPKTIEPQLVEAFMKHDWPGNVREVENEIRRLVAITEGGRIPAEDWEPRSVRVEGKGGGLARPLMDIERDAIEQALRLKEGNRAQAAELLGISLRSLYYKIKQYGL